MVDRRSVLRSFVVAALILAIFIALGIGLYRDASLLRRQEWSVDPWKLALSLCLLVGSLTTSALVWKKILGLFDVDLDLRKCFKITFVSSMGKYLPGKVWAYVSQVYLAQKVGVPVDVCLYSAAVFFLAYNFSGLIIFVLGLFVWTDVPASLIALALAGLIACIALLFSRRFLSLVVKVGSRISRPFREGAGPNGPALKAKPSKVGAVVALLAFDWLVLIASVHFLVNSFYEISLSGALVVCGTLVVSVISGVLAFFVPAGLGVREGVGSYLLGLYMPSAVAIVIVLAMRIWLTVGELACFLAALRVREPRLR